MLVLKLCASTLAKGKGIKTRILHLKANISKSIKFNIETKAVFETPADFEILSQISIQSAKICNTLYYFKRWDSSSSYSIALPFSRVLAFQSRDANQGGIGLLPLYLFYVLDVRSQKKLQLERTKRKVNKKRGGSTAVGGRVTAQLAGLPIL